MNPIPTYKNVHPGFKLNGFALDREDLCRIAYTFVKEGEEYEKQCGMFLLDWFDACADIEITTSGTTGAPKAIRMSKQAMVHSALATGEFFGLHPGDKALHCLPTKFIAGKMMFVRAFVLGLDMEFVEPVANPLAKDPNQYDFGALVPLQAETALEKLHQIKKIIIGGAKVGSGLEKKLKKVSSKIYETYGMTETVTHIAAKQIGEAAFTVLPGVEISQDAQNCLVINAPRISDEPIVTNDLVDIVGENQFVFLGRRDNVVNSGGIKLIPEQIEAKLSRKINSRFFVAGVPDETLGEKLVLFVEGEEQGLEEDIFSGLGKYEKPKEVRFVPVFSETVSGKIKRKEIAAGF